MSLLGGIIAEVLVDSAFSPDAAEKDDGGSTEDVLRPEGEEEEDMMMMKKKKMEDDEEEEEEEEMMRSAHLEPSTLPWPGGKDWRPPQVEEEEGDEPGEGAWSEGEEERDTGISAGSLELSEKEGEVNRRSRWRESMPEGEKWRDEVEEEGVEEQGDGFQADDEEEEEEEEEEDGGEQQWMSEKARMGFTPQVTIVNLPEKKAAEESRLLMEEERTEENMKMEMVEDYGDVEQFEQEWKQEDDKFCE